MYLLSVDDVLVEDVEEEHVADGLQRRRAVVALRSPRDCEQNASF